MAPARLSICVFLALFAVDGVNAFVSMKRISTSSKTNLQAQGSNNHQQDRELKGIRESLQAALVGVIIAAAVPQVALADGQTKDFRLPPIDFADKSRCVLKSSSIGQANAARDKLYDLRMCDLAGADASGFDLSGVITGKTNLANSKLIESYFSKGYLRDRYDLILNMDDTPFTIE